MPIVDEVNLNKTEFIGLSLGGVLDQIKNIITEKKC